MTAKKNNKRFVCRFHQLLLNKQAKEGKSISLGEVSRTTGISYPTIARWNNTEIRMSSIEADTLLTLLEYFDCKFEDLFIREHE